MNERTVKAVNWRELLFDLRTQHQMTFVDIAMHIGHTRESLRNYYNRVTTPSHVIGERLVALWISTTSNARESLPMEKALPSVARSSRR